MKINMASFLESVVQRNRFGKYRNARLMKAAFEKRYLWFIAILNSNNAARKANSILI
jgi:hypothetical protein